MIPLTGITLPFVSYGGSSMVVSFALLGLIQSVSIKNYRTVSEVESHEDIEGDLSDRDYLDDIQEENRLYRGEREK